MTRILRKKLIMTLKLILATQRAKEKRLEINFLMMERIRMRKELILELLRKKWTATFLSKSFRKILLSLLLCFMSFKNQ